MFVFIHLSTDIESCQFSQLQDCPCHFDDSDKPALRLCTAECWRI